MNFWVPIALAAVVVAAMNVFIWFWLPHKFPSSNKRYRVLLSDTELHELAQKYPGKAPQSAVQTLLVTWSMRQQDERRRAQGASERVPDRLDKLETRVAALENLKTWAKLAEIKAVQANTDAMLIEMKRKQEAEGDAN